MKSALFGTPAPTSDEPRNKRQDKQTSRETTSASGRGPGTPTKPPGILLTPGTGATRRKRVSFGQNVGETPELGISKSAATTSDGGHAQHAERPGKALQEGAGASKGSSADPPTTDSEGEWEEEDDYCTHDITVDLNEPHSQSGRYWKEEFEKYHEEAKAEMEKLLKYKQLAKSYARQRDAEANQLAERLRDEQQKVIDMEKKIAENASRIVSKHRHQSDADPSESLSKLTEQTTLAAQYRHRVQELEAELGELVRLRDGGTDGAGRRRRHVAASPTTQKTLVETQRELRRARTQLKELDSLREEVLALKARLKVAEAQASKNVRGDPGSSEEARVRHLKAQLDQSREESRKKTEEMRQLKSDFEAFRKESEVHEADTKAVLERAHTKISDLKKEMKTLKAAGSKQPPPASWRSQSDALPGSGSGRTGTEDILSGDSEDAVGDSSAPSVPDPRRDDAHDTEKRAPNALTERTNLEKPRWQPFVPRSPRNRAYLGNDVSRRLGGRDAASAVTQPQDISAPTLPAMGGAAARGGDWETALEQVDLLQGRFVRLGGPDTDRNSSRRGGHDISGSMRVNISKSSMLPPERRAAARARVEKSMAERKRGPRRGGYNKENQRP